MAEREDVGLMGLVELITSVAAAAALEKQDITQQTQIPDRAATVVAAFLRQYQAHQFFMLAVAVAAPFRSTTQQQEREALAAVETATPTGLVLQAWQIPAAVVAVVEEIQETAAPAAPASSSFVIRSNP
jgi:hypothetical protein